jgi:hypothetical protein
VEGTIPTTSAGCKRRRPFAHTMGTIRHSFIDSSSYVTSQQYIVTAVNFEAAGAF